LKLIISKNVQFSTYAKHACFTFNATLVSFLFNNKCQITNNTNFVNATEKIEKYKELYNIHCKDRKIKGSREPAQCSIIYKCFAQKATQNCVFVVLIYFTLQILLGYTSETG